MTESVAVRVLDVLVVGAGFTGLYMLKKARELGFKSAVVEAGDDVGGAWYWNRYPGLRCDSPSHIYCYSFDPELTRDWNWSERYPERNEIYAYLRHVSERYDLRKDIQFSHSVTSCTFDENRNVWSVKTDRGFTYEAQFIVAGTGCLTASQMPAIEGIDRFRGRSFHTSRWPEGGVDFTAKRVAVIGTGATAVQCIPLIALQAKQLTVFQRTPTYCIPARNGHVEPEVVADRKNRAHEIREKIKHSFFGFEHEFQEKPIFEATTEEREAVFQQMWDQGGFAYWLGNYSEMYFDEDANRIVSEFLHKQIRAIVHDSETAEKLVPKYAFGTKRSPLETNYYDVFNKANVRLIDATADGPIEHVTESGIVAAGEEHQFDIIVYATGFDAMTGALRKMNIVGRDGAQLNEQWSDGPHTYLGLMVADFPNLFTVTGPQSPSAFSNVPVSIEQHVEMISGILVHLRDRGLALVEPTHDAQSNWGVHLKELVDQTIIAKTDSWYVGSNVPGKPRTFMIYLGPEGVGGYRRTCDEIVADDYRGFKMSA
ncbi:MAG: NAD(P)/FAD-dependent oxidoreductase [Pseudomonadota bacterium]